MHRMNLQRRAKRQEPERRHDDVRAKEYDGRRVGVLVRVLVSLKALPQTGNDRNPDRTG